MVEVSSPTSAPQREPRYIILLVLTILSAAVGAVLVALAFAALLSFAHPLVGFIIGLLLFGLGLPLFLALRAAAALRRRNRGLLLRRLVVLALIGATHLALFGAVMQWSSRTTGNLAWAGHQVLDVVGGIPVVSELLYAHAERNNSLKKPRARPVVGPDGGVILDAGPDAPGPDGGPATALDGGPAAAVADAGSVAPPVMTPSARGPQPPKAKPGIPLSARAAGKAARVFAAGARTTEGDPVVVVGTIAAGGVFTARVIELGVHEKLGDVTIVEAAEDGTVAAILGGQHLVVAGPGKTTANVVKSLAPGAKLGELEIQAVRDVVVGPGGSGLAVVELLAAGEGGDVVQHLVTLPKAGGAPSVLRKTGDKVPGSTTDATIAKSWSFKKGSGAGSVLVAETYLEGGDDLGTRLSGETFTVNPQRLLVVKLDAPKALQELARTGLEPSGIAGFELQIFGDAALLPDGRAVFDANFLEKGADGWLFLAKPGGAGVFALAPEKRAGDDAPWTSAPPRARSLDANADGNLVFRRDDGAAILTSVDRPADASAALLGADGLASDGKKLGTIASVDVPLLVRGGEWLIASVQLATPSGTHDAVVVASRADVANGKAEVILEVGGKVPDPSAAAPKPGATPPKERRIQSLRFFEGRDELLWQK